MARKLAPGGYLHAATDWVDYAEHMSAIFGAEQALETTPPSSKRPLTKFEQRGLKLGHEVRDLHYRKR